MHKHDFETRQYVRFEYRHSDRKSSRRACSFPRGSSACIHVCTSSIVSALEAELKINLNQPANLDGGA